MKSRNLSGAACALCLFTFAAASAPLHAAILTLDGASQASATIRNDATNINNNFGGDTTLIVGTTIAPAVIRTVLSFSLADIPAGSTINSITLSVRQSGPDNGTSVDASVTINLHQLTSSFTEGTGNAAGANNGNVSWNVRGPTSTAWGTVGGDFNSGIILGSISANPEAAAATVHTFATSGAFVTAAQSNIGGTLSLIMKLGTEDAGQRRAFFFNSDETTTINQTPTLTIDYTIPEPSTAILAALAGAAFTARRRR